MEVAWSSGVRLLADISPQFKSLRSIEDWEPYRPHDEPTLDFDHRSSKYDDGLSREHAILRALSDAQKVFHELQVVTVHMRGRAVHRRITERLVTCRDPHEDVAYFTVNGFRGETTTYIERTCPREACGDATKKSSNPNARAMPR